MSLAIAAVSCKRAYVTEPVHAPAIQHQRRNAGIHLASNYEPSKSRRLLRASSGRIS